MTRMLNDIVVMVKGGGEVATAVAHRLAQCHFKVYITEIPHPYCPYIWNRRPEPSAFDLPPNEMGHLE